MWIRFSRPAAKGWRDWGTNRSLQFVQTCANLTRHCLPPMWVSMEVGEVSPRPLRGCVRVRGPSYWHACRVPVSRGRRLTLTDQNRDDPQVSVPSQPAPFTHNRQPQPNFAINFPTFNKIRKRNSFFFILLFFLPLEFFNCHKFILIQREIYEWQIEFENWVIFFLSFYIGNLRIPDIAILK